MDKTFRGDITHLNKQFSSKYTWLETKRKVSGEFEKLVHRKR